MKKLSLIVLLSILLFSCDSKNIVKTERKIAIDPVIVMKKEMKDSGIYYPNYNYQFYLYSSDGTYWYSVDKKLYEKYNEGDTLSGEVVFIIKTYK